MPRRGTPGLTVDERFIIAVLQPWLELGASLSVAIDMTMPEATWRNPRHLLRSRPSAHLRHRLARSLSLDNVVGNLK